MNRPRILCDPNPLCYGSVSALRAIIASFPEARFEVLATGPVVEQCPLSLFERIIELDVKDPDALRRNWPRIDVPDLYLAVSNNANIPFVVEKGVPIVFVDIVFWMKRGVTTAMQTANRYLIESFPGVEERLSRYRGSMRHAAVVGPLIHRAPRAAGEPQLELLVNLGGAASPYLKPGVNTSYPQLALDMVAGAIAEAGIPVSGVIVAMGAEAAGSVQHDHGLAVRTLDQEDFLHHLASSRRFLTAPGLNAPFEGFWTGVPVSFLPPQNLTQVYQLVVYQEAGLAPAGLNLPEVYPDLPIDPDEPEAVGSAQVLEGLARLAQDRASLDLLRDIVAQQLIRPTDAGLALQGSFLKSLGEPGGPAVVQAIRNVLSESRHQETA